MNRMRSLKATLAASVCLLPLQAFAQSDDSFDVGDKPAAPAVAPAGSNWVDLGAEYQSAKSYYLNRFTGAVDPGFQAIGGLHYNYRDPWDSGGTKYIQADGRNLGLDDRSIAIRAGEQGTWGIGFSYDGIPYYANDIFPTIFQGNGALVPGVAPGGLGVTWKQLVPANGAVNSLWYPTPTNSPSGLLQNQDLYTQRDVFKGTGKYQWGAWTITAGIRHEHKEGWQANSLEIGGAASITTAGTGAKAPTTFTSGVAYFAQPINYDMDRYDVAAEYGNQKLQVQTGFTYSQFTDNETLFNAQNPYAFTPTTSFGTTPGNISAPYVLPPSNSASQVRLLVGYNIGPLVRLNANFQYGLEFQNDPYQTATGDPTTSLSGLPRGSFGGKVETIDGNVAVTANPIPRLDLRAAYTINEYNNESPRNAYPVDTRSTTTLSAGGDCTSGTGMCLNIPYGWTHQTFALEAGYRILPQTKLLLSESYETMDRTFADVSRVSTNTVTAKIRSNIVDGVFGALSYSHQDRYANNYVNDNATWAEYGTTLTDPKGFLMYFEASRVHDDVKASVDLSPSNAVNGSFMAKFSKDRYPGDQYGLRNNRNIEVGPDVSWEISPSLNTHAYYTYQQIYYDMASIYAGGSGTAAYSAPWTEKTTDSVQTFGATLDWSPIKDVLKIGLDYNFSYGDTAYALGDSIVVFGTGITSPVTGPALAMQSLPDVKSMLNMVKLHGEYTFAPNMTVLFGYAFERFTYKDFMYTTANNQYANALLPGTLVPNDSVHVVSAALRIRF